MSLFQHVQNENNSICLLEFCKSIRKVPGIQQIFSLVDSYLGDEWIEINGTAQGEKNKITEENSTKPNHQMQICTECI